MGHLANPSRGHHPYGRMEVGMAQRSDHKTKLLNRLNRVEGHIRGIVRMVEDDRYCIDVLTQLQAARAALAKVESEMLKAHMNHCIERAIVKGDAEDQRAKARELIELLDRSTR
jgi:DNA-binding FrmR family transcriptional regulator